MSRPFKLRAVLRYLDRNLFSTSLKKKPYLLLLLLPVFVGLFFGCSHLRTNVTEWPDYWIKGTVELWEGPPVFEAEKLLIIPAEKVLNRIEGVKHVRSVVHPNSIWIEVGFSTENDLLNSRKKVNQVLKNLSVNQRWVRDVFVENVQKGGNAKSWLFVFAENPLSPERSIENTRVLSNALVEMEKNAMTKIVGTSEEEIVFTISNKRLSELSLSHSSFSALLPISKMPGVGEVNADQVFGVGHSTFPNRNYYTYPILLESTTISTGENWNQTAKDEAIFDSIQKAKKFKFVLPNGKIEILGNLGKETRRHKKHGFLRWKGRDAKAVFYVGPNPEPIFKMVNLGVPIPDFTVAPIEANDILLIDLGFEKGISDAALLSYINKFEDWIASDKNVRDFLFWINHTTGKLIIYPTTKTAIGEINLNLRRFTEIHPEVYVSLAFASSFTGESGDRENVTHYKVAISGPDSRSLLEFSTKLAKLLNEAELFDEPLIQSDVMSRPALELIPIKKLDIELTKRIIRFCLGGVRLGRLEKDGLSKPVFIRLEQPNSFPKNVSLHDLLIPYEKKEVPLENLVKFHFSMLQFGISRMDQQRSVVVSFDVPKQMDDRVKAALSKIFHKLSLPKGYRRMVFRENH